MPAAPATTVSPDLLLLAFVAGFALAALIFWPLLHRAQHQAAARPARHVHRQPPRPVLAGATAPEPVTQPIPKPTASEESTESAGESVPADLGDIPEIPTGLYEQNHAEQFERTRARLERLRAQLKNW